MWDTVLVIWENIYVGIICAILTAIGVKIIERFKNYRINRKYNLTGLYVTKYADIVDGEKKVICTPAVITQKGWNIVGETSFGDTVWKLEGKILDSGYVYGMYSAEGMLNNGVGNFFLEMDTDRLEGIWSGYDNVNKIISSGEYIFSKISIHKMNKRDIGPILKITDVELGKDYLSRDIVEEYIDKDKLETCLVVTFHEKIIGYCLCDTVTFEELRGKHRISNAPSWANTDEMIGLIKTIAIQKKWQCFGIGELIIKRVFENWRKADITVSASIAWMHGGKTNVGKLLEKVGMKSVGIIEEYWKEDSIENNYGCPVCGEPPCTCSADIYFGLLE